MKSGYVAIIGRPNVGKSTLFNALMNAKLTAVSPKPQTTRIRITGILTSPDSQIILWDCPGLFQTKDTFNKRLVKIALSSLKEIDLALWLIDCTKYQHQDDQFVLSNIRKAVHRSNNSSMPIFLLINKLDSIKKELLLPIIDLYRNLFDFQEIIPISALKGINVPLLKTKIEEYLPAGPQYYENETLSDLPNNLLLSEFIREKIYLYTHQEVPYLTAVIVNEIKTIEEKNLLYIQADIIVGKTSIKKIIVGNKGQMIKRIGTAARKDIEQFFKTQMKQLPAVYLDLFVKVKENWTENPQLLSNLGL
ncbi:MAG: GTPase Era [Candidatus Fischerbacteria bacterium RBG_13_37_8]|uniref:GTPase Era n=1 Tax=Candidatus Fischerbacteria bacterium RBG_13_37_8 TaxID=1817863 RepID=A0A1F5VDE9_9BACT|nr:MAG: GTPase Era [Candidatus Fischerbacteria bacterium RBG_13_37_8]